MTTDSPKPRREVKVDLSGLSPEQVSTRTRVIALGEMTFGASRWQTDLARAITTEAGRRITQGQVSHWVSGLSPVPPALLDPIRRVAIRVAEDLEHRADEIRAAWVDEPTPEDAKALDGLA